MFCRPRPTNIAPAIVHPTKCCTNHNFATTIVPHIHPSHTTTVNHHMFQHKHYFPHTESVVSDVSHQHFNCPGPGPMPGPGMGMGPGMGPGFGAGPGMAPGMGPGMGMGPGFGAGPGMAPGMGMGMGQGPGMFPGMGR
jgi:spore coat protein D